MMDGKAMTELDALIALADAQRAEQMAQYHKIPRRYLGVTMPQIDDWPGHGARSVTCHPGWIWRTVCGAAISTRPASPVPSC